MIIQFFVKVIKKIWNPVYMTDYAYYNDQNRPLGPKDDDYDPYADWFDGISN